MHGSIESRAANANRCVLLILDGLGDLPVAALGGKTPLEAARTPVLDRLASTGSYGLVDPIGQGVIPNTHTGVGVLMGLYPGQADDLKRGPVEAFGAGRILEPGQIAFRANLATLEKRDERLYVRDRRAGRIRSGTRELAQQLDGVDLGDGVKASFQATDQHRGALIFSGAGLGDGLSDTDPGDGAIPALLKPCRSLNAGSQMAARKVNQFISRAHELLRDHPVNRERLRAGLLPANGVITRGAGKWSNLDNLLAESGVSATLVVGCNTVTGLGRIFGMDPIVEPGFTADVNTDVRGKLTAALNALEHHQLVYVHIKAPDLFAHDFEPEGKKAFLEQVDQALEILEKSGAVIAIAADHTTDSNTGAHTDDPVPVLISDPGRASSPAGHPVKFGESACRDGNLPRQTGHQFLLRLLGLLSGEKSLSASD
jgi:2,3-bisphosphoglycerate-independent phosphoglycerate mutase